MTVSGSVADILIPVKSATTRSPAASDTAANGAPTNPFSDQFDEALNQVQLSEANTQPADKSRPEARDSRLSSPANESDSGDSVPDEDVAPQSSEPTDDRRDSHSLTAITDLSVPNAASRLAAEELAADTELQEEIESDIDTAGALPLATADPVAKPADADAENGEISLLTGVGQNLPAAVDQPGSEPESSQRSSAQAAAGSVLLGVAAEAEKRITSQTVDSKTSETLPGQESGTASLYRQLGANRSATSERSLSGRSSIPELADGSPTTHQTLQPTAVPAAVPPAATAAGTTHGPAELPVAGQVASIVAQELRVHWAPGEQVRAISVRLDPPELGALRIHVRSTADGLQLQVAAEEGVTLEMLASRVPEIEQLLRHQEVNVHRVTIQRLQSEAGGSLFSERQSDNSPTRYFMAEDGRDQPTGTAASRASDRPAVLSRRSRLGIRA